MLNMQHLLMISLLQMVAKKIHMRWGVQCPSMVSCAPGDTFLLGCVGHATRSCGNYGHNWWWKKHGVVLDFLWTDNTPPQVQNKLRSMHVPWLVILLKKEQAPRDCIKSNASTWQKIKFWLNVWSQAMVGTLKIEGKFCKLVPMTVVV